MKQDGQASTSQVQLRKSRAKKSEWKGGGKKKRDDCRKAMEERDGKTQKNGRMKS